MRGEFWQALVVDDEEPIRSLLVHALREEGVASLWAADGAEALSVLRSQSVEVVVADVSIPHPGGLELLEYVRRHLPGCPVVLITGRHRREYLAQALMLGAFDYVEKPFDASELARTVRRALDDSGPETRLSQRAAEAIELRDRSRQAALQSVRALARAVEAKDPYTRRHSDHVTAYATALCREVGVDGAVAERVRVAALLHDVGKIGVPDSILTKPGRLTEAEFVRVRTHPELGAEILANVTVFGREAELVRRHHEHWDGRGYPDGLDRKSVV